MVKENIDLREKNKELKRLIFKAIVHAGGGHLPSSFSIAEILTVLYYKFLNVNPLSPDAQDRDRFILSKGHAAVGLYSILAMKGFFSKELLRDVCRKGSILGGHPDMHKIPGVDASTGSLGHGFPFAVGIAFSAKKNNKTFKTYTVLGDGECQEGSIWEAALFAAQHKLDNLIAIVDYNKLQAIDPISAVSGLEPLNDKWSAFGWDVYERDGNDIDALVETFEYIEDKKGKPKLIVANTIKGKGISYMEGVPIWHYRMPNNDEMKVALKELGLTEKDLEVL